jgi:HD-GYP domain-containing protein (c-di-GMP phosphodiesterase class II)
VRELLGIPHEGGSALKQITEAVQRESGDPLLGATVDALACTLGLRDDRTGSHSGRVVELACRVGRLLRLDPGALRDLTYAAHLHDIGKVGVPDAVLRKAGPLESAEWKLIEGHAERGADLVARVPGLERVSLIVRHHHERFDGCGYPAGLSGKDIPIESRILAVADAYVAMTEERPYRRRMAEAAAERELCTHRGSQFDPRVVDALRVCVNGNGATSARHAAV